MLRRYRIKAVLHMLLAGVSGLALMLSLLLGVLYYVAVSGQDQAPELVTRIVREHTGAEASFASYRIRFFRRAALVSVVMKDVTVRDSAYARHGRELLNAGELTLQFDPLRLLRRQFVVKALIVDSARVRFYRSADGYFNAAFLDRPAPSLGGGIEFSLHRIQLNELDLHVEDSLHGKSHRVIMRRTRLRLYEEDAATMVRVTGRWFFHGLSFKPENGAFLDQQTAEVDLTAEIGHAGGRVRLLPSRLVIGRTLFGIRGYLQPGRPAYLKLDVTTGGVRLAEARPLLAANLRRALRHYEADRPIRVRLGVEGPLRAGRPLPADLTFSLAGATLSAGSWQFTNTAFRGRFYNCDPDGPVNPRSGCLRIDSLSARLLDRIDVGGAFLLRDLSDPQVLGSLTARADLAELSTLLPPDGIRLRAGAADLSVRVDGRFADLSAAGLRARKVAISGALRLSNAAGQLPPPGPAFDGVEAGMRFDADDLWLDAVRLRVNGDPLSLTGHIRGLPSFLFGSGNGVEATLAVEAPRFNADHFLPPKATADESAPLPLHTTPDSVAARVGAALRWLVRNIDAGLSIRTDELRYRAFRGGNAILRGRLRSDCDGQGPCLKVDTFAATLFDALRLGASFTLTHFDAPHIALDARLRTPLPALDSLMPEGEVRLLAGHADLALRYEGPLERYIDRRRAVLTGHLHGVLQLHGAALDYLPGNYHLRDLEGVFRFDEKDLMIAALNLSVNDNALRAEGRIPGFIPSVFLPGRRLKADLRLSSPRLDFARFGAFPARAGRSGASPAGNKIAGVAEAVLDRLDADVWVEAGEIHYRSFHAEEVSFQSRFTADCPPDSGGCVVLEPFSARLFGNTPLRAAVTVRNLVDPLFLVDARVAMPLTNLGRMFPPQEFQFLGGMIDVGFHYEGRLLPPREAIRSGRRSVLAGQGRLSGAAFDFLPRGYRFRRAGALFSFNADDLYIDTLGLELNQNPLVARGYLCDLLPFLFDPERQVQADLQVEADAFNFDHFTAPARHRPTRASGQHEPTPITEVVEAALDNIEADLLIRLGEVRYRQFRAGDVAGELSLGPDRLAFRETGMSIGGGAFQLRGHIDNLARNQPRIDLTVGLKQTDVSRVFQAFENFGQQALTAENIRGQLTATVRFRARADDNYDIDPASIDGHIDLRVLNGALINLPMLMNINKFIFKKRDMDHVLFATLENTFEVKGRELIIHQFDVFSSALTFGVEGRYSFGDPGSTDLLFEVPISNLFRGDLSARALESLHDRKLGLSVLLRATEKDGRLRFRLVFSRRKN